MGPIQVGPYGRMAPGDGSGLPVVVDGEVVGGIGLSSGTPQQDMDCAQAALAYFANQCT